MNESVRVVQDTLAMYGKVLSQKSLFIAGTRNPIEKP